MNNQFRTSLRDTKILTMFLLSVIEKFIDRLETKLADIDPSLMEQHVRPLKKFSQPLTSLTYNNCCNEASK